MLPKLPVVTNRRPLEGGTLMADFLGGSNLLSRTRRLEQSAEEMATEMLSASAAEGSYVRRRGAMLFTGWGQPNVPGSQSAVTLSRFGVAYQAPLVLPFAGSVISLMIGMSSARTAGTLTVEVYIAGSASGFQAVIDGTNTLTVEETAQVGEYAFDAGEQITLRITTSGWTPTSADALVMIEVAGA